MNVRNTSSFLLSFLCTSAATAAAAAAVQVFPNFLSSKEVEHYRLEAAAAARNNNKKAAPSAASAGPSSEYHRLQLVSTVTLKENVHDMVRTALLAGKEEEGTWVKKLMLDTQAQVTTLTSSTLKSRVDYYYQDGGAFDEPVKDLVGFIFLTEEEDAYFRHGADTVFSQTGTLVTYNGDNMMEHETVIPQGKTLEILGPFAVDGQCLSAVGPGKKKTSMRKWLMQSKIADKSSGQLKTVPVIAATAPRTLGSSAVGRLGQKTSKRKLMSDKGGKDQGGGGKDKGGSTQDTTAVATVPAPAPAPTMDMSTTTCGCKASNGVVQCITTGCGSVGTSTTFAPPPTDPAAGGTTTVAPPPDDVFVSTPVAPAAPAVNATTPATPAEGSGGTGQLEFTPPAAPDTGMVMTWEMRGGTGPCICTTTSSTGGYCVGECGMTP